MRNLFFIIASILLLQGSATAGESVFVRDSETVTSSHSFTFYKSTVTQDSVSGATSKRYCMSRKDGYGWSYLEAYQAGSFYYAGLTTKECDDYIDEGRNGAGAGPPTNWDDTHGVSGWGYKTGPGAYAALTSYIKPPGRRWVVKALSCWRREVWEPFGDTTTQANAVSSEKINFTVGWQDKDFATMSSASLEIDPDRTPNDVASMPMDYRIGSDGEMAGLIVQLVWDASADGTYTTQSSYVCNVEVDVS
jgi:hypothetical protein